MSDTYEDHVCKPNWMALPLEIKSMIMHQAPDIPSLLNLIQADSSLQYDLKRSFRTIFPSVLSRILPQEMQQMACKALNLYEWEKFPNENESPCGGNAPLYDERLKCTRLKRDVMDPIAALKYVETLCRSVEFFTRTFRMLI